MNDIFGIGQVREGFLKESHPASDTYFPLRSLSNKASYCTLNATAEKWSQSLPMRVETT
ncbi:MULTISPECIES: hypothetical protein [unclassified Mesorhizobium]|uniref:hypothetical protein n=1 Tax=unclassified Mesorhizobium TaxID=325217 RepID=UPI00167B5989|nr:MULTISPECIES: hypothetical protein [unclassified Mesorhizobium]